MSTKDLRRRPGKKGPAGNELRFIPLGGLGQIGKNMFVLECGEDIIVVDCGLMFPDEEMLGIDFVIPDASYLFENRERIRGLILTHGHEDHIGSLPFILPRIDVPIYGTKLTLAMVEAKFRDSCPDYTPVSVEVGSGERFSLGCFSVTFLSVCHSIPDGVGLAMETPAGTVIHTGDFKLDPTPVDGRITDYSAFAEYGRKGVLLMLSDSTNVERPGFTQSERIIGRTLERLLRLHRNRRVVIAAFSTNLHRAQQILQVASRFNRKVALMGRSMVQNVNLAIDLGYIDVDKETLVPMEEANRVPDNKLIVLTTGSQGEPFSGLVRMSKGEHRFINLGPGDLVAVFASPIPGNERLVSRTINRLFECGCEVVYDRDQEVHVSGHAAREELKMMLSIVRPQYFVPLHGEYRHLVRHAKLAQEMDIPQKNTFVLQNGDVLSLNSSKVQVRRGAVPSGGILVDGMALGEMQNSLLKERQEISEEGIVIISLALDSEFRPVARPLIESVGFLHMDDAEELRGDLVLEIERALEKLPGRTGRDEDKIAQKIRSRARNVLRRYSRTPPVIRVQVMVVER
ncbi:MAG TPA: ribonuclease J [Synergistales bacterium]|jgi:ribonuclease J|nr:ribonuclease J [Synergistales bacterium]MDD4023862.1 ribonuclease J [Synergistales bacterium]MDY0179061.1 ribonuclease J [Synergistaceae bacterium]HOP51784.1 ribonuclease J [Synergistales bacterium]HPQ77804.1 ribonuclease J [Synergistales bacterium]